MIDDRGDDKRFNLHGEGRDEVDVANLIHVGGRPQCVNSHRPKFGDSPWKKLRSRLARRTGERTQCMRGSKRGLYAWRASGGETGRTKVHDQPPTNKGFGQPRVAAVEGSKKSSWHQLARGQTNKRVTIADAFVQAGNQSARRDGVKMGRRHSTQPG